MADFSISLQVLQNMLENFYRYICFSLWWMSRDASFFALCSHFVMHCECISQSIRSPPFKVEMLASTCNVFVKFEVDVFTFWRAGEHLLWLDRRTLLNQLRIWDWLLMGCCNKHFEKMNRNWIWWRVRKCHHRGEDIYMFN